MDKTKGGPGQVGEGAEAGTVVGVVDVQRVIARSEVGVMARQLLDEARESGGPGVKECEDALLAWVLNQISEIIQVLAKARGYAAVFERTRAGTLYLDPAADLTDDVTLAYNLLLRKLFAEQGQAAVLEDLRRQIKEMLVLAAAEREKLPGLYL